MDYNSYLSNEELKKYREHTNASVDDMLLDNLIEEDISSIENEVGGQQGMYDNFPISRVYRNNDWIRVYCLTSEGGIAIIQTENKNMCILTLGEDDGYFFLNSRDLYCNFYGEKVGFVWALSEALSLFNNIK